jgi:hypothetical protein
MLDNCGCYVLPLVLLVTAAGVTEGKCCFVVVFE